MNPLNESLENKINYKMRVSVGMQINIPKNESKNNGLETPLSQAVEIAKDRLRRMLPFPLANVLSYNCRLLLNESHYFILDAVPFDKKWLEGNERIFDSILFLGKGDYSLRDTEVLLERLKHAIDLLGGLQQGGHDENNQYYEKYIENVARDVVMALTGKEIEFVE